jgi:glycosyltransferase involved in cell wall biosynthesis
MSAMKGINEMLSIIGDGPEKPFLLHAAKESNIKFLGELDHDAVIKNMMGAKFLVLPTLADGLPNVVLEAMSVGCPVISTLVGGIPDVIESGKTGFLVKPRDIENLRKHMLTLLNNEKTWAEMHHNCLSEVKKYSWEYVERKVEKLLNDITVGKPCRDLL